MEKPTEKQMMLLRAIQAGGGEEGELADVDQILERLEYKTSKQSLQFSFRALANHDWISKMPKETRRGSLRRVYALTEKGKEIMNRFNKLYSINSKDVSL